MKTLAGLTASPGIVAGRACVFRLPDLSCDPALFKPPAEEKNRLDKAFSSSKAELEKIKNTSSASLGEEYGHIFRAQMTILEDDDFRAEMYDRIDQGSCRAETAVDAVYKTYEGLFSGMDEDSYNAQRLADLSDVCKRVQRNLLGIEEHSLSSLPPESIVAAVELFPSDTVLMDKKNIRGFVTEKGGLTSHVAILAKSLSLPAAVGTAGIMNQVEENDDVVLDLRDFEKALVYVNPAGEKKAELEKAADQYRRRQEELFRMKDLECVTVDGKKIVVSANIGSIGDLVNAVEFGAKSVGLFRTEFLFLGGNLPDEEEQYRVYAEAAKKLNGGMLIIRTLDIGGDKEVKALALQKEKNPFLGLRGIRLCLKYEDLFLTQLRALLRAAVHGDIRIMFPMISSLTEFRRAKELAAKAAAELAGRAVPYRPDPPLGVMIETPAAVLLADELSGEAAFVSMGTNDLTQYMLCVDRDNGEVSSYYQTLSPALLRAVGMTGAAAEKNGIWAGVCGELAGNPLALPVLVGLGVEELSVAPQLIPQTVARIRSLSRAACRETAKKAASLSTEDEVKAYLASVQ
ncbi:MAG: phosphoenolpyruvate--protein phosphotransferase [Treponema sp.]|jgi:phosphotransferase system enzyme I (PtsI)|nr:phosphoenolpyruvate--protein phosphotransferase [Treponema sp.]